MPAKKEKLIDISFPSDGFILSGTLHLPVMAAPPVVIGSHGLYASRKSPKQIALALACNAHGIAFFRFDHRGCGGSQGEFEKVTSLAARNTDLKNAIEMLINRNEVGDSIGLFGSSMGGTVCLSIAPHHKISAIVTFAAPLRSRIADERPGLSKNPDAPGIFLDAKKTNFDITAHLPSVNNLLIIHGDKDEIVPVSHAEEIHRLAGDPKKLLVQKNGDHRMSDEIHQNEFIREASLWFKTGLTGS
jgi:alpha-beta hydrolase superfamily lysophospholipase